MKIGLKIYSTNAQSFPKLLQLYESGIIQYAEVYIVPDQFDSKSLAVLKEIPIIFHAPNFNHHFSFTRDDKVFRTALKTIHRFVDFFEEKRIIIHPGYVVSGTDNISTLIDKISNHPWLDIILENVPAVGLDNRTRMVASSADDIKRVLQKTHTKFCLDFGHAAAAARFYGIETIEFTQTLLQLQPYMFHISDAYDQVIDSHLPLGEGSLPLKDFRQMIQDQYVSLETPKKDFLTLTEDIENIRRLNAL